MSVPGLPGGGGGGRGADHSDGPIQLLPPPATVLITGAAGAVAYCLAFFIAKGLMLPGRPIRLVLLDLPAMQSKLDSLAMELEDIASPFLSSVLPTSDAEAAFAGADFALLVGARPRAPGMERRDLLEANAAIFRAQGELLERLAQVEQER